MIQIASVWSLLIERCAIHGEDSIRSLRDSFDIEIIWSTLPIRAHLSTFVCTSTTPSHFHNALDLRRDSGDAVDQVARVLIFLNLRVRNPSIPERESMDKARGTDGI